MKKNHTAKMVMATTCNLRSMMKQLTRRSMNTTVIQNTRRNVMRKTMKRRQKHMMMWRLRKRLKKRRTLHMTRKKGMRIMTKLKQRQKLRGTSVCTVDTYCPFLFNIFIG